MEEDLVVKVVVEKKNKDKAREQVKFLRFFSSSSFALIDIFSPSLSIVLSPSFHFLIALTVADALHERVADDGVLVLCFLVGV